MLSMLCETIFDDRNLIGCVVELKPSRWSAYSGKRRFCGEFPSFLAATNAILVNRTTPTLQQVGAAVDRNKTVHAYKPSRRPTQIR
jgi:hypothetical protein